MPNQNRIIDDRYEIKAIIGQGGMADVYLAEDLILKREVAVKILREVLAEDPIYVQRFKREASAAATLSNKNIVEIYDVGEENGKYYIVMEYVSGQTLKELIFKRGALHMAEAIDVMKQVANGVAAAHKCGIIHRDLKPQNILVTNGGIAKIADFGIASVQTVTNVTKADTIMGSLHYLAPEIARGEKATIQSDIYSLGIMFYELLVGQVPFNGESPVNIALKHMREELPSVREINPTIYQSVENIIIKATAKNVENRYQNANQMLEDLKQALDHPNDEKITFVSQEDDDTTIVVGNEEFYSQPEISAAEPVVSEEDKKAKKKKQMKLTAYAGMVAVILFVVGLYIVMANPFAKKEKMVEIPNVVGKTLEEAKAELEKSNLVVSDLISYTVSDEYEENRVVTVNPSSGKEVKEKSEVRLTVSKGKYILIGNYLGKNIDTAKKELDDMGMVVNVIEQESEEAEGTVISQSIDEGQKIVPDAPNKIITLKVSSGLSIKVENYLGMDVFSAKANLESQGFVVTLNVLPAPTAIYQIQNMKINVVEGQSLSAGTVVHKKGEAITLDYYDKKPDLPTEDPDDDDNNGTNNGTNSGGSSNNGQTNNGNTTTPGNGQTENPSDKPNTDTPTTGQ